MSNLYSIGELVASRRKALGLTQSGLGLKAGISRATIDALENGRTGELGYTKVAKLLAALGQELAVRPASPRCPTLDELMQENRDAEDLDRRS